MRDNISKTRAGIKIRVKINVSFKDRLRVWIGGRVGDLVD
jgi:hypothetical protein